MRGNHFFGVTLTFMPERWILSAQMTSAVEGTPVKSPLTNVLAPVQKKNGFNLGKTWDWRLLGWLRNLTSIVTRLAHATLPAGTHVRMSPSVKINAM